MVKYTADLVNTNTGKVITFDGNLQVLMSAAASFDNQLKPKKSKDPFFSHDVADNTDVSYDDDNFDSDPPITTLQAFATDNQFKSFNKFGHFPRVRVPPDKWLSLDSNQLAFQDKHDDKAKSIILGYDTIYSNPSVKPSNFKCQVNLHDRSAYVFFWQTCNTLNLLHLMMTMA